MMFELQGLIFTAGSILLLPTIMFMVLTAIGDRTLLLPRKTSVPTAIILWIFALTNFSMGGTFFFAGTTSSISALLWTMLIIDWSDYKYTEEY